MDKISIAKMEFLGHTGCFDFEKKDGQKFIVSIDIFLDRIIGCYTDDLNDTVNYAEIYDIVSEEMSIPSELLENVAGRIIKSIAERYPQLERFSIRVSKSRPPVDGTVQWSRVTLFHSR